MEYIMKRAFIVHKAAFFGLLINPKYIYAQIQELLSFFYGSEGKFRAINIKNREVRQVKSLLTALRFLITALFYRKNGLLYTIDRGTA